MVNLKDHIKSINCDYTETLYANYMKGEWGITVGYVPKALPIVRMQKRLADWQLSMDCHGELCIKSRATYKQCNICPPVPYSTVVTYPTWGNSPFPQIDENPNCNWSWSGVAPATIQTVNITVPPLFTLQYTVGATDGPIPGAVIFAPVDSLGNHILIGKTIDLFQLTVLQANVDYSFDTATGTITLLAGRIFNGGEVYTIISF
jgi:hypothetical protein